MTEQGASFLRYLAIAGVALLVCLQVIPAAASEPVALLQKIDEYPHTQSVDRSEKAVIDHEVGLGALQKLRGAWRFDHSERLSGDLVRYTWQIIDGFSSEEVMQQLVRQVEQFEDASLLYECSGRACGNGSEWANRVFRQRILYGRSDAQRYRVYRIQDTREYRLMIYASLRTADRQYLHAELLSVTE